MLGECIVPDEQGKVTGVRVTPPSEGHELELTFQTRLTVLGVPGNNTGTVVSRVKDGGVLESDGRGIFISDQGDMVTWTFSGILTPKGPGLVGSFRGMVPMRTSSPALARLNTMCIVVEAEVDSDHNMSAKLWEWA